jgi:hypothetical protein
MKLVKDTISIIKSIPKPVWVAVIVPGGFLYIGFITIRGIYRKVNQSNKIGL